MKYALKKAFFTGLMAICGLADVALGVFALNQAGTWIMEDTAELKAKAKAFIHEKTKGENSDEV